MKKIISVILNRGWWNRTIVAYLATAFALYIPGIAFSAEATSVPLSDIVMVDGGAGYGLALKKDGTVVAWGDNSTGQLGNGTGDSSLTPVQVSGLGPGSGVIAISAGNFHAMALKDDGTMLAWGANVFGQLGDGTVEPKPTPVEVLGLDRKIVAMSAGFTHSLALAEDGTVWCWGRNGIAACGIGATQPNAITTPVQVHGVNNVGFLTDVTAISAGANSSMALKSDGTVLTWGNNNAGQVGNGSTVTQLWPFEVLQDGIAIANASITGANSNHAVKSDGTVWAWGNNSNGQLGDGTKTRRLTPVQVCLVYDMVCVEYLTGVTALATGNSHALALKEDGTVLAWGNNSSGQLGDGTTENRLTPVQVSSLSEGSGVTAIAGGDFHSFALKSNGTVLSWGDGNSGQLGDGVIYALSSPVQTFGLGPGSDVAAASGGNSFSLALKADGTVLAWGENGNGQLGDGTTTRRVTPVQVATLGQGSGVKVISAGSNHALALKEDGTVLAWGNNSSGQLGNNSTTSSLTPVEVFGMGPGSDVIAISAAASNSFALKDDGTVWSWGFNTGQLGDGTETQRLTPVQVHGPNDIGFLTDVKALICSDFACYALQHNGTVLAWGYNGVGSLGDGTRIDRSTPVQVYGLDINSGVVSIGAYGAGGYALKNDGTVLAWGSNLSGAVGNGNTTIQLVPVQTSGLAEGSGVLSVSGGSGHALALKTDGTVLAWGANNTGQLGDGTTSQRLTPVSITALNNVKELSAYPGRGGNHSLAVLSNGTVLAWGANNSGQLGDGTAYTKNTPSPVVYEAAAYCDIDPDRINTSSGKWATMYYEPKEPHTSDQIVKVQIYAVDVNGERISDVLEPKPGSPMSTTSDSNGNGVHELMRKFDRASVQALVDEPQTVHIVIKVLFEDTRYGACSHVIRPDHDLSSS